MELRAASLCARDAVGLSVTGDGLFVEGVAVRLVERCAGGDECVDHRLVRCGAGAKFDAGWIDTLFFDEVLTCVEGSLGGGV